MNLQQLRKIISKAATLVALNFHIRNENCVYALMPWTWGCQDIPQKVRGKENLSCRVVIGCLLN